MSFSDQFFLALGITPSDRQQVSAFAERSGVPQARLRYYNDANVLPSGGDLARVLAVAGVKELELALAMGCLSRHTLNAIQAKAGAVAQLLEAPPLSDSQPEIAPSKPRITLETELGRLYSTRVIAWS
jgi:site-specific DNA-methyltransferase (adenine-specific)